MIAAFIVVLSIAALMQFAVAQWRAMWITIAEQPLSEFFYSYDRHRRRRDSGRALRFSDPHERTVGRLWKPRQFVGERSAHLLPHHSRSQAVMRRTIPGSGGMGQSRINCVFALRRRHAGSTAQLPTGIRLRDQPSLARSFCSARASSSSGSSDASAPSQKSPNRARRA